LNSGVYGTEDNVFAVNGVGFDIASSWQVLVGQSGNTIDVVFTPVPEPAIVLAVAGVALWVAGIRRGARAITD
jgi:hypothetical protein